MRSMTPELPDSPEAEQVEAWVELAQLSQDPDFRAAVRRMAAHQAASHAQAGDRKSTRLNSSHLVISYAVFCLKKKKSKHGHTDVNHFRQGLIVEPVLRNLA